MKHIFSGLMICLIITSCGKHNANNNYDYNVDTTNPSSLPLGSLVADVNGVYTDFDSAASINILYTQINGNDTEYIINIVGFYDQPSKNSSLTVNLRGVIPFDTATFINTNLSALPGENIYALYYYTWVGGNLNSYDFISTTPYKATITYIDDSTMQGTFSGYLPPFSFTNGAFNLKTAIPSSFIK